MTADTPTPPVDLVALVDRVRGLDDDQRSVLRVLAVCSRSFRELRTETRIGPVKLRPLLARLQSLNLASVEGEKELAIWSLHSLCLDRAGVQANHWRAP